MKELTLGSKISHNAAWELIEKYGVDALILDGAEMDFSALDESDIKGGDFDLCRNPGATFLFRESDSMQISIKANMSVENNQWHLTDER